mgnify:CR=1 FL=1
MSQIHDMRPLSKELVIDLVRAAGVDVSDWSNYSGGHKRAATNPRYCYEWAFMQPGEVVVLNLWYELLRERRGTIFQELNLRKTARNLKSSGGSSVQIRRAMSVDEALRTAFEDALPVRAIINDGARRMEGVRGASRVKARSLDPSVWHVGAYDFVSGTAVVVRGARRDHYVDQFSAESPDAEHPSSRQVSAHVYNRDARVRSAVLARAGGRCEHCGEPGFTMPGGVVYLETHHVVPLAEDGPDVADNVIALCPNHHRRAHYGLDREQLRAAFLEHLVCGRK